MIVAVGVALGVFGLVVGFTLLRHARGQATRLLVVFLIGAIATALARGGVEIARSIRGSYPQEVFWHELYPDWSGVKALELELQATRVILVPGNGRIAISWRVPRGTRPKVSLSRRDGVLYLSIVPPDGSWWTYRTGLLVVEVPRDVKGIRVKPAGPGILPKVELEGVELASFEAEGIAFSAVGAKVGELVLRHVTGGVLAGVMVGELSVSYPSGTFTVVDPQVPEGGAVYSLRGHQTSAFVIVPRTPLHLLVRAVGNSTVEYQRKMKSQEEEHAVSVRSYSIGDPSAPTIEIRLDGGGLRIASIPNGSAGSAGVP